MLFVNMCLVYHRNKGKVLWLSLMDVFFLASGVCGVHAFELSIKRQVGHYEFKASMVYIASSRLARVT